MLFSEILATLPPPDGITALVLLDSAGNPLHQLNNQPGTAGSVRVYHALAKKHGQIDKAAAAEGLALYAEHTADARAYPGKHSNIDRLLAIAEQGAPGLQVRVIRHQA